MFFILNEIKQLNWLEFFCVACEARSTHSDDNSGGGGGLSITLLVSDRYLLKGCINFIYTLQKSQASLSRGQVWKGRLSAEI